MKLNYIKIVALSLVLVGMATSCQKDSEMEPSQELSQKSLAQETSILFYKIDGEEYYKKFSSEKELNEYIDYLIKLTSKGHIILIESNEKPNYAPEDNRTFKTNDKLEMKEWLKEMKSYGYDVELEFDEETGTYKGTAIPKETERGTTAISTERDSDSM